jgi:hypothetical protein
MDLGKVFEKDKTLFSWKKVKSVNHRKCPVCSSVQIQWQRWMLPHCSLTYSAPAKAPQTFSELCNLNSLSRKPVNAKRKAVQLTGGK